MTAQKVEQEAEANKMECTFKPKINNRRAKNGEEKSDKWKELHQQAQKYHMTKVADRDQDEIEIAKEKHEYTFKPTILGDSRAGKKMLEFAKQKAVEKAAKSFIQETIASAEKKKRAESEKPNTASAPQPTQPAQSQGPDFVEMDIALGK